MSMMEQMAQLSQPSISGSARPLNAKDQLAHEQTRLEDRLVQVKRGQEILAKNPELLELLEILANRAF